MAINLDGAAIFAVGAVGVVWSLASDHIPAKWPFRPIERIDYPEAFWAFVALYGAAAVLGMAVAAGLVHWHWTR